MDLRSDSAQPIIRFINRHIFWAILAVVGLIYALSLAPTYLRHDTARYVMLAKSIASGQGYRALNLPGNPPYTLYPFGFPLLLAPIFYFFPNIPANLIILQLVPALSGLLSIPVVYFVLKNAVRISPGLSATIALISSLLYQTMGFSASGIWSESPYTFFSFVALLLLTGSAGSDAHGPKARSNLRLFLAMVFVAAGYFVRVVGFTLFVAAVVYFLVRRDWKRTAWTIALFIALILPWAWRNISVGNSPLGSSDYYDDNFMLRDFSQPHLGKIDGMDDLAFRLVSNVWGHATQTILELLMPTLRGGRSAVVLLVERFGLSWAVNVVGLCLLGLIAFGFVASIRREVQLFDLYVFFYVGLILLPPWQTVRNLVPIAPFLLLYLVVGLQTLIAKLPFWQSRLQTLSLYVVAALLCLTLVSNLISDRHHLVDGAHYRAGIIDEREKALRDVSYWIQDNLPSDVLLLHSLPETLYLYADRRTLPTPPITGGEFVVFLQTNSVDFAVIELPVRRGIYDQYDELYLWPAIEEHPEVFVPVYETPTQPRFVVYQVGR